MKSQSRRSSVSRRLCCVQHSPTSLEREKYSRKLTATDIPKQVAQLLRRHHNAARGSRPHGLRLAVPGAPSVVVSGIVANSLNAGEAMQQANMNNQVFLPRESRRDVSHTVRRIRKATC